MKMTPNVILIAVHYEPPLNMIFDFGPKTRRLLTYVVKFLECWAVIQ